MSKFKPTKIITILTGIAAVSIAYIGYKNSLLKDNNSDIVSLDKTDINKENVNAEQSLPVAEMKIKNFGTIKFVLYPSLAPNTVNNFVYLCNIHFYDNLYINRIIKNFIIQGGMDKGDRYKTAGYYISDEISSLKHKKGTLSMAKFIDKDSASCQFFVVTKDAPELDGHFTSFGKVIEGNEILDQINNIQTIDNSEIPKEDIMIESITIDTKGINYPEPEKI